MHVVLTGATGSIGKEILRQCIKSTAISHITVLGRRSPTIPSTDKFEFIKHTDFTTYPTELLDRLRAQEAKACIWCLGVSTSRVGNRKEYETVNKDYPIAAAKAFKSLCPNFRFIYTSILGADPTSWFMILSVRGETDQTLLAIEGLDCFIVRPGAVETENDENPTITKRLGVISYPLFRVLIPSLHIYGDVIATGFIKIATEGMVGIKAVLGEEKRVILSREMKLLGMNDSAEDSRASRQ